MQMMKTMDLSINLGIVSLPATILLRCNISGIILRRKNQKARIHKMFIFCSEEKNTVTRIKMEEREQRKLLQNTYERSMLWTVIYNRVYVRPWKLCKRKAILS